ncbi:GNAT family N-acetyltransferase [Algicella marina]|uniref:GNAT family N-acetyltransferase n=1 Tax=Algicella marina TaxID=2683284 RepID=A0A6P1T5C0_9RHOB|nr:GNAT family N-acetyltransferase [Algicella marina]QHQ36971.1 GNAT family N-acetyltransferase [Algicella marina]
MMVFTIRHAEGTGDLARIAGLFTAYAQWLEREHGLSLCFQGFEEEVAGLPGRYAPPGGVLLLAEGPDGDAWGCIGVRPLDGDICEVKRLYVLPEARGHALGKALVAAILEAARGLGYRRAVLDTAPFMAGAQRIYEAFGFTDIPAYYENPLPGVRYMAAQL